jgi:hypothetical protein
LQQAHGLLQTRRERKVLPGMQGECRGRHVFPYLGRGFADRLIGVMQVSCVSSSNDRSCFFALARLPLPRAGLRGTGTVDARGVRSAGDALYRHVGKNGRDRFGGPAANIRLVTLLQENRRHAVQADGGEAARRWRLHGS